MNTTMWCVSEYQDILLHIFYYKINVMERSGQPKTLSDQRSLNSDLGLNTYSNIQNSDFQQNLVSLDFKARFLKS